jgi:ribosomal peptide maturation radical SAM protein 1
MQIPVEGSRGCWWGDKQHCTFCGLDDRTLSYRSKSSGRLLRELDELSATYGIKSFWPTDNILDLRMIDGLFARLAEEKRDYELFFNLKANMTRDQIRTLRKGGLISMTPGIESLSSRILKLMGKGCTKLQHLAMMKWSTYYGIMYFWNLLHGFPGERIEDYADQLETLRLITHLRPPQHCWPVWHVRFSPMFEDERFPNKWRRPSQAYSWIYPKTVNLEKLAYYFECEKFDVLPEEAQAETEEFVSTWQALWESGEPQPALTYNRTNSDVIVDDTRSGQSLHRSFTLSGPDANVYEAFAAAPRTPAQACATLASECPGAELDEEAVTAICDDLCEAGLMIGESGKYLSLAIPADPGF